MTNFVNLHQQWQVIMSFAHNAAAMVSFRALSKWQLEITLSNTTHYKKRTNPDHPTLSIL
jgi:hypothetical protein